MIKKPLFLVLTMLSAMAMGQGTTPNMGLSLPARGTLNWDVPLRANFTTIDTFYGRLSTFYQGPWNNSQTYIKGQQVSFLAALYSSLVDGNLNNPPSTSPVSWSLIVASPPTSVDNHLIYAGPISGGPTAANFRPLATTDLPSSVAVCINNGMYIAGSSCYPTVHQAIAAACSATPVGATVWIPPGSYPENTTLSVLNGTWCNSITLLGSGSGQCDSVTPPSMITTTLTTSHLIDATGANDWGIYNVCLKNTSASSTGAAINLSSAQRATGMNIYISGPFLDGIRFFSSSLSTASTIWNNFTNIHCTGLAPNGIGVLFDSSDAIAKVINNNNLKQDHCTGGTGGVALKFTNGPQVNTHAQVINENEINCSECSASGGTGILFDPYSSKDTILTGTNAEGSTTCFNKAIGNTVILIGGNISSCGSAVVDAQPQFTSFLNTSVQSIVQTFGTTPAGGGYFDGLGIGGATPFTNMLNMPNGGCVGTVGGCRAIFNTASPNTSTPSFQVGSSQSLTGTQGSTGALIQAATGSFVAGHTLKYDASGNAIDSGVIPGTGTVTNVSTVNDTNVTGTVANPTSTPAITLGWTGTLAKSRTLASTVYTDQTNVFGAFLQDFTAGTMEIPEAAGFTANVDSTIGLDLTAKITHLWTNNADSLAMVTSATDTTPTDVVHATAVPGVYASSAIATGDLPSGIPISKIGSSGLSATAPATINAAGNITNGLANVTNDAQTKASVMPNTAPGAGQVPCGNAGGTTYAPCTLSGSGATISLASTGVETISAIANASLLNSTIQVNTTSPITGGATPALGGSVTIACATCSTITNGAGNNVIPKSNATNFVASSVSDDGTTVSTTEGFKTSLTIGVDGSGVNANEAVNMPNNDCLASGGNCRIILHAGDINHTNPVIQSETACPTNLAASGSFCEDTTQHEWLSATAGASSTGMMVRAQPGAIHQTAKTAVISTATLCASSAGACNIAGLYHVHFSFWEDGTACGTPATGGVTFLLTWTDFNGTTHSAISLGMDDASTINAVSQTFHFQSSLATAWASGDFNIATNGSIIQYATGYTACGVGTGSYGLDIAVTRVR